MCTRVAISGTKYSPRARSPVVTILFLSSSPNPNEKGTSTNKDIIVFNPLQSNHITQKIMKFITTSTTSTAGIRLLAAVLPLLTSVNAFAPSSLLLSHNLCTGNGGAVSGSSSSSSPSALWAKIGIWYSSSTGNTDTVAAYIAKAAGVDDYNDIGDAKNEEMESADALIIGAPTWHTGSDTERSGTSWDDW